MENTVTLPSREEIMKRLTTVDPSDPFVEKLYPRIASRAGESFNPMDIAYLVIMAISQYAHDAQEQVGSFVASQLTDFIAALIDDENMIAEAVEFAIKAVRSDICLSK